MLNKDTTLCISLSARPSNIGTRFHNYLYDALDLDYVYKAFAPTDLAQAIAGVRGLGIRGCAVSMPYKEQVIALVDELDESARAIDSVNTIVNTDGRLVAYNTDYLAIVRLLRSHEVATGSVLVRGSGGMAKAVVAALRDTGFSVPADQRGRIVDITVMGADGKLKLDDGPSAKHPGAMLNSYPSGAGGLYSTAPDFMRFCRMLLEGGSLDGVTLLGRKTVEQMMVNHLTFLDPPVTQFSDAEGFGLGGSVLLDPARKGRLGSVGQFGWSGAASTYFSIDPEERMISILMLQHLPNGAANDLPRIATPFYNLVYQALVR